MNHHIRNDWKLQEIDFIYHQPLLKLVNQASSFHQRYQKVGEVQICTLLSIKTGNCPEDCAYCPQSSRYHTGIKIEKMMDIENILAAAKQAKEQGSTRFCMGAAWRNARKGKDFKVLLRAISEIRHMGLEVCCTLGMLTDKQAQELKKAGLYAYNHNLDSSEEFYKKIITTRSYQDRLNTLKKVRDNGISVCCGGIIGMGETHQDRIKLLYTLATLEQHPESVPINALIPVKGTPLEKCPKVSIWDMIRMIATTRTIMPKAMVRLSAGRVQMTPEEQALCFMAGANSIFSGEKLLTTTNNPINQDKELFEILGIKPLIAYSKQSEEYHQESSSYSNVFLDNHHL